MDRKITIVGPEPTPPHRGNSPRKVNIDAVLLMAKYDESFRRRLLADRGAVLKETGLDLSLGEELLLLHVPDEQLEQDIEEFRIPGVSRSSLASWAKRVLLTPKR